MGAASPSRCKATWWRRRTAPTVSAWSPIWAPRRTSTLGGAAQPLAFGPAAPRNPPVTLSAGALTPIAITATGVKTTLTLSWQSAAGVGWQPVPGAYLFTQSQVDRLRGTYVRFLKAASLASALSLDANEIAYLDFDPSLVVATSAKDKLAVGPATVHPASMANIAVGVRLSIDAGAAQETIEVTSVTATSFTATMANAHDGSGAPFPIASAPSPDIGRGWLNTSPGSPYRASLARQLSWRRRGLAVAQSAACSARLRAPQESAIAERRAIVADAVRARRHSAQRANRTRQSHRMATGVAERAAHALHRRHGARSASPNRDLRARLRQSRNCRRLPHFRRRAARRPDQRPERFGSRRCSRRCAPNTPRPIGWPSCSRSTIPCASPSATRSLPTSCKASEPSRRRPPITAWTPRTSCSNSS